VLVRWAGMLKYKHSYKIRYSEAILSNNTRKLLWFEITKLKNRVIYNNSGTLLFPTGSIRRIFGEVKTSGSRHVLADRQTDGHTDMLIATVSVFTDTGSSVHNSMILMHSGVLTCTAAN